MEKFLQLVLGTTDLPTYAAYFVFAAIGAFISLYIDSLKRDKASLQTPYGFSLSFLTQDNLMRLIVGFFLVFLAFRFSNEFIGKDMTVWAAPFIGASTDRLAKTFENIQNKARQ